jgi:hypothetical protein
MKTLPSDPFLRGYIVAALFTTDPNMPGGCDYAESGRADDMIDRVPQSFIDEAARDCAKFLIENSQSFWDATKDAPAGGYDSERAGHDLWYSRNGHGVGYWDRDLGDVGDRLHSAAKAMGEHHLELGGWWIQSYRCKCGECWTRPEDSDNDPDFGEDTCDTCDACGATIKSDNRKYGEHLKDIEEPEEATA